LWKMMACTNGRICGPIGILGKRVTFGTPFPTPDFTSPQASHHDTFLHFN
jgi:hypothetical protein